MNFVQSIAPTNMTSKRAEIRKVKNPAQALRLLQRNPSELMFLNMAYDFGFMDTNEWIQRRKKVLDGLVRKFTVRDCTEDDYCMCGGTKLPESDFCKDCI